MLNDKENEKYNIIEKVVNGTMTRKEAMCELKKSRQQIYRLINLYYSEGKEGFIHGNRGKNNPNKINENLIKKLRTDVFKSINETEAFLQKKYESIFRIVSKN